MQLVNASEGVEATRNELTVQANLPFSGQLFDCSDDRPSVLSCSLKMPPDSHASTYGYPSKAVAKRLPNQTLL